MSNKLEKAQFFIAKGKFSKARPLLLSVVKQNKNQPEGFILLGKTCLELKQYKEAAARFKQALELDNASGQALAGLGKACMLTDELELADQYFKKSLENWPSNTDAVLGISNILLIRNQPLQALSQLQALQHQQPKNPEILSRIAAIKIQLEAYDEAKRLLTQILQTQPAHSEANRLMAKIFAMSGYVDRAISCLKKVLAQDSTNLAVLLELGDYLVVMDRCAEAEKIFAKAFKLNNQSPQAVSGLATALNKLGKYQQALNIIQPIIDKGLLNAGIAKSFLKICNRLELCEQAIYYAEQVLSSVDIENAEKTGLYYQLGGLYDKRKQYDAAFADFKCANDSKPDHYSAIEYDAYIDAIIRNFSRQSLASAPSSGVESNKPVFIVGMPRSGTSLTEQILCAHSRVYGAGELRNIADEMSSLGKTLQVKYPAFSGKLESAALYDSASRYLEHIESVSAGEDFVTDKMPHNFLYLGMISLMFPLSKIIHCKRNPRDIALSIYFQNFHLSHQYSTRLENIVKHYKSYERLMNHWKLVLDMPVLEVQYEDMVSDQRGTTQKMLDFIGLEWDEKCERFYDQARSVATSSHDQVNQKMYSGSIERWKNYEKQVGELFDELGI